MFALKLVQSIEATLTSQHGVHSATIAILAERAMTEFYLRQ
jgi:hypothetical protein